MNTCPLCENDNHKCECPDHLFHKLDRSTILPVVAAANPGQARPTKERQVKIEGMYYWEDWDGVPHEKELKTDIVITIEENDTAKDVEEKIQYRLNNL